VFSQHRQTVLVQQVESVGAENRQHGRWRWHDTCSSTPLFLHPTFSLLPQISPCSPGNRRIIRGWPLGYEERWC